MDSLRLSTILPVSPMDVYDAWLSSDGHTAMTGGAATSEPRVGARHTAWGGYITGKHLELEPGKRILQSWRTTEFPDHVLDSKLEIRLVAIPKGTRLTLLQSGIPDGQGEMYSDGWQEHYFVPMKKHFKTSKPKGRAKAAKTKKASKAKRAKPVKAVRATKKTPTKKTPPKKTARAAPRKAKKSPAKKRSGKRASSTKRR